MASDREGLSSCFPKKEVVIKPRGRGMEEYA
jgi:hypothetical protein